MAWRDLFKPVEEPHSETKEEEAARLGKQLAVRHLLPDLQGLTRQAVYHGYEGELLPIFVNAYCDQFEAEQREAEAQIEREEKIKGEIRTMLVKRGIKYT